jgi:putative endopeptidase
MLSSSVRLVAVMLSIAPATLFAQRAATKPLDRANLDTTCAPCTDFDQFANGAWLKRHTIPPDKTGLGSFGMLSDKNQEVVQKIVIDDASLARSGETKPGTNEWKIGTFYMACMDTVSMDAAGVKPIKPLLDAIAAAKTTDDIVKIFGNRRGGGGGGGGRGGGSGGLAPFGLNPQTDPKNSTMVILAANQGGLTLNREDYLDSNDRATRRRQQYVEHVARSLQLIGESESQAKADADTILALETRLAKITIPQADLRDPNATYHKMTLAVRPRRTSTGLGTCSSRGQRRRRM